MIKGQAALFTLLAIGATLICLLGTSFLGPAGTFLNLLTPFPAAYIGMRFGLRSSIVVVVVTALLLIKLATLYSLMAYLGMFGLGSLLMPYLLRRPLFWDRSVFYTTLGSLALTLLMIATVLVVRHQAPLEVIDTIVQNEVDQAMQVYTVAGLEGEQLQQMQQVVATMADFVKQYFFGLYIGAVMGLQFFCLWLLHLIKRRDYQIFGTPFSLWKLPVWMIWVLIFAGFATYSTYVMKVGALEALGKNLLVVVLPLYFLQGLAVVINFMRRKKYPAAIKGLVIALLLILNPLQILITGVGVFDLWVDFRRPRTKN